MMEDRFREDWDGDAWYEDRYDRPATEAEAHVEWHLNAGVPMGQPCPWDACDPEYDRSEYDQIGLFHDPGLPTWEQTWWMKDAPFWGSKALADADDDLPF